MAKFLRPNKASLKNAQHFEFIDAFITVLAAAGLSAAKIVALLAELRTAFSEEDRLYMIARTSEIIAQRDQADRDRDDKYGRVHSIVRAWAGSGHATLDAVATAVKHTFDLYKVKTSAQIDEESGQLDNLITDLSTQEMQARLQVLGVDWLFAQMVSSHQLVKSLRLEQGAEESEKVTGALKAARQACDELYDKITYLIEAFTLTAEDPAPYEAFIKRWNGTLKIYQDVLDRKSGTSSGGGSSSGGSGGGGNNNGDNGGGSGDDNNGGGSGDDNNGGGSGDNNGGGSGDNGGDTPGGDNGGGSGDNGGDTPGGGDNGGDTPGGGDNGGDTPGGGDNGGGGGNNSDPTDYN